MDKTREGAAITSYASYRVVVYLKFCCHFLLAMFDP
jgi:hypothetical protein